MRMNSSFFHAAFVSLACVLAVAGCASTGGGEGAVKTETHAPTKEDGVESPPPPDLPKGMISVDVTNILGVALPARVEFRAADNALAFQLAVPKGALREAVPVGSYKAYVHVYESDIPVMVAAKSVVISEEKTAYLLVTLLEGTGGKLSLLDFDFDGDLAIDRVEMECETDPEDANSIPGRSPLPLNGRVFNGETTWYKGELFAHSTYGRGSESVTALVRRAERSGMDFLAITDRNTLAATSDPGFHSEKVVLIPAMAWGNDTLGEALIFAPRTMPDLPESIYQAQAECMRVQAQGGLFAVAHPCFSSNPWRWGTSYVNAIQAWCRPWRSVPPLRLDQLEESFREKEDGNYLYSLAAAAALDGRATIYSLPGTGRDLQRLDNRSKGKEFVLGALSANTQGTYFWDLELGRGLSACGIAGSDTDGPKVPMGEPLTYVLAENKSVPAIVEALRLGRTTLSAGPEAPFVDLWVDVRQDGSIDARIGASVSNTEDLLFYMHVKNGKGKKCQLLMNGHSIYTQSIDSQDWTMPLLRSTAMKNPQSWNLRPSGGTRNIYRARVIGQPKNPSRGFDPVEVFAMTSPIYARDIGADLMRERNSDKISAQEKLLAPIQEP
jgi:hypothetical protein